MKPNLNKFAAILLFACAAIICSLTMWATPTVTELPTALGKTGAIGEAPKVGASHSPFGTVTHCVGADPAQIVFPFADDYSCIGLGAVPGLPNPYGGLTFKYRRSEYASYRRRSKQLCWPDLSSWSYPRCKHAYHWIFRYRQCVSDSTSGDRSIQ